MATKRKNNVSFKFKPFSEKQLKLLNFWAEGSPVAHKDFVIADGSIRSGKSAGLSTLLFTPDGYKTMGEIKVGDYVFNENGEPTKVVGVYPQPKKEEVYEITFHDGSKTNSSKTHLWTYTTKKCVANGNKTMFTSELGEIMADLERHKDKPLMNQRAGKYRFPLNGLVQFKPRETKIDPYLLGLLLGDGGFTEKAGRIKFTNSEKELHDAIETILPKYDMKYKFIDKTDSHCAYGTLQHKDKTKATTKTPLRLLLEEYNLYGCYSHNKFVPEDYKFNDAETRVKILAGLLNTDGSVNKDRPSIQFISCSRQLVDDVALIARSLGMFVNTDCKSDTRDKNKHDCHRCNIRVNDLLYEHLSEKHKSRMKTEDVKKFKEYRMIKEIKLLGVEKTQCIKVDCPSHLYLTDDFIVTHNTTAILLSFVLYVMSTYEYQNAGICSKSISIAKRNLIAPLKQILYSLGFEINENRSGNYLEIYKGDVFNVFHLFGGKDESSQDDIQGITLCSILLDEVVLMPKSFVEQALGRCSVEGSKYFFTCNPASPYHWFYTERIKKVDKLNGLYLHFTMDDNLSLSEEVKRRYKNSFSGIFYKRFIEGLWVLADGLVYDMFDEEIHVIEPERVPLKEIIKWWITVDYGTGNSTVFLLQGKTAKGIFYTVKEYYYSSRADTTDDNEVEGDTPKQKTDLEYAEDMKDFISRNQHFTGLNYKEIQIIVDPSASSFKEQLRRFRMKVKNAQNEVIDGIRIVSSMIKSGRYFISKECPNTIKEKGLYSWDEKKQLEGIDSPKKLYDHCLSGSTIVNTDEGDVAIKDLVGKEGQVYTLTPDGKTVLRRYYNVRKTKENANIIRVNLENGDLIEMTPEHLVLTYNRGWVEAQELTIEDDIVTIDK